MTTHFKDHNIQGSSFQIEIEILFDYFHGEDEITGPYPSHTCSSNSIVVLHQHLNLLPKISS